ncbi:hypothetical protein PG994_010974 [Apiospora phragmitis]|uniref:Uncharacterized protein n=1 Tax=Apiospora phragmitis TaxID=2905665 RepID=A0ABR1TRH5_9PEZI
MLYLGPLDRTQVLVFRSAAILVTHIHRYGAHNYLHAAAFQPDRGRWPGLNKESLEYLTLEDSALTDLPGAQTAIPSRGFSDDLCYGTGITYLTALSLGGAWGLQEGLRRSAGQPPKLRLNSVLNAVTRRGPFLGNWPVSSPLHTTASTPVLATSGSTKGLRPMMISGAVVGSVAGAWAVTTRVFFVGLDQQHERQL